MISYKIFILFLMLFMHYIEDFHIQGCLVNLKQKKWWEKQMSNDDMHSHYTFEHSVYKNDYRMSLFAHSIENALFVMLPLIIDLLITEFIKGMSNTWIFFISAIVLICITHYVIDDEKANKMKINLVQDQLLHLGFIVFIFVCYFPIIGAWIV